MTRSRHVLQQHDSVTLAAQAAVEGSLEDGHWHALLLCCARDGRAAIAAKLAELTAATGPAFEWWDCQLQLRLGASPSRSLDLTNRLLALEASDAGPPTDPDRHALNVSAAVRHLQSHLQRVLDGHATPAEVIRIAAIARELRREG